MFVKFGKQGSTLGGLLDAVSISVSLGLQSGIGLETFATKYIDMRFESMGYTDDPVVPTVTSVLDYVFRRLALDHLDFGRVRTAGRALPRRRGARTGTGVVAGDSFLSQVFLLRMATVPYQPEILR